MAKRLVYLVTPLLFAACAPDLPREIYIEDGFKAQEESDIVAMIDEMNKTGQELLGRDLIAYQGRHQDADGWDLDDADDGYNVIYKQVRPDANYDYIQSMSDADGEGGFVAGLGMNHDILVYAFTMFYLRFAANGAAQWCASPFLHQQAEKDNTGGPDDYHLEDWAVISDDCGRDGYSLDSPELRNVALHEMGHFIGLAHISDPDALMNPVANGAVSFTDADKRALCCVYECVTDQYECVLPRQ